MVGGNLIQFIDTPGLLDGDEFELAEAIIAVPNGIHALGVVINIECHVSSTDEKLYEDILALTGLTPYVFMISHMHID